MKMECFIVFYRNVSPSFCDFIKGSILSQLCEIF